jgi:hypothetical protein
LQKKLIKLEEVVEKHEKRIKELLKDNKNLKQENSRNFGNN